MSARKKLPRNTKWCASTWERRYRGDFIWIENMYTSEPKWSWNTTTGDEGRAKTKLAAMRSAERSVDASLKESTDT